MTKDIVFELCCESLHACLIAAEAGTDRLELCSELAEDGLTPGLGLMEQAILHSGLPVHVMIRPRGGDFVYTAAEYDLMCDDLLQARSVGASGAVAGILDARGTVDVPRMHHLVTLAAPLPVTFHRAFDVTPDLTQSLEDVIASGCRRVLTSGGMPSVAEGAATISRLVIQAGRRIDVAAGGGLRLENAAWLAHTSGARHFHGTARLPGSNHVNADHLRALIQALRHA